MSLKKMMIALGAVVALSAVVASSAMATAGVTPSSSRWYENGVALKNNTPTPVKCKATGKLVLEGSLLGLPTKLEATGVDCIKHAAGEANENSKIENTETAAGSGKWIAEDFGRLKFTEVKVVEPAGCKVPATIQTNPLKSEIYIEGSLPTPTAVTDKFEPTSGPFVEFPFEDVTAGSCAVANPAVPVSGYAVGLAENAAGTGNQATGVEEAIQRLKFSVGVNETFTAKTNTKESSGLTLGKNVAHITGTVDNELTTGSVFGVKEK